MLSVIYVSVADPLVRDADIAAGAQIQPFTHIDGARVGAVKKFPVRL